MVPCLFAMADPWEGGGTEAGDARPLFKPRTAQIDDRRRQG